MSEYARYPSDLRAPPPGEDDGRQADRPPYASWGRRVAAALLDSLIVLVAAVALGAVITGVIYALASGEFENDEDIFFAGFGFTILLMFPIFLLYEPLFHGSSRGQTPGKRAVGIYVARSDGTRLGYGRAFGRYGVEFAIGLLGGLALSIPQLLDVLWPLWDDQNQTLHDKAVDSVVLRV